MSAVAGPARAEGRAVGLALGLCALALHADPFRRTAAVDGIILAVGDVTAHAGVVSAMFFIRHVLASFSLDGLSFSGGRRFMRRGFIWLFTRSVICTSPSAATNPWMCSGSAGAITPKN